VFNDVHVGDFAADWMELHARRHRRLHGTPCPDAPVSPADSVFLLKTKNGSGFHAEPVREHVFADVRARRRGFPPPTGSAVYADWNHRSCGRIRSSTAEQPTQPDGGVPGSFGLQ
jgi:hypothetical protein